MISLEKKQLVLIEYYQHNMSQRQIAEKLKMSRNRGPVRKMRIYNVKEKRTQNKSMHNANCWAALVLNSDKV